MKLALQLGNDINAAANFGDYPMVGDPQYTLLYYPLNAASSVKYNRSKFDAWTLPLVSNLIRTRLLGRQ